MESICKPGTWTAEISELAGEGLGKWWIVDGPDYTICTIDAPKDHAEAIAHLIEASPDLYMALKDVCQWMTEMHELLRDKPTDMAFDRMFAVATRARAALAKADGGKGVGYVTATSRPDRTGLPADK